MNTNEPIKEEVLNALTDEQIDQIAKITEENVSPKNQLLRDIQNGNIPEYLLNEEDTTKNVVVDPITGNYVPQSEADAMIGLKDDIDAILGLDIDDPNYQNNFDVSTLLDNDAAFENASAEIKEMYGSEIKDDELPMVINAVKNFVKGIKPKYEDMPQTVKNQISKAIMELSADRNAAYVGSKALKNQMTEEFISQLSNTVLIDQVNQISVDLNKTITNHLKNVFGDSYLSKWKSQHKMLSETLLEVADKCEQDHPERAKSLRAVSKSYMESYTMESFFAAYKAGKIKIKKFDLEKPSRAYGDFNRKYAKSKWIVKNVEMLAPILDRNLDGDIPMKYITAFIVAFCKYTMNMNPENLEDHAFMYYFINNITLLDIYKENRTDNEDDKEFFENLLDRIYKFIDLIKERI